MDLRKLKTLIDLVAESNIKELEVTEGDNKVRIIKTFITPQNHVVMMQPQSTYSKEIHPTVNSSIITTPIETPILEGYVIKSPMVGTFYRSSAPGVPAFVEIGKEVKKDETLCIIEAMKLLNEIDAEKSGVIKQILVDNGQPVEFGQPLFVIN